MRVILLIIEQKQFLLILCSFWVLSSVVYGQSTDVTIVNLTLPEVALVDIEPENTPLSFTLGSNIREAGEAISAITNNSKWLNYTSAVPPAVKREITVRIIGGIPSGLSLKLKAAPASSGGAGDLGVVNNAYITLSNMENPLITNIGGAYTGDGINNGHQLTFSLEVTDIQDLVVDNSSLTVVYTIKDL